MLLSPTDFQGDWSVSVDVMEESMMRQERRAEAQSLMQMAGQLSQVVPLNMKAFMAKRAGVLRDRLTRRASSPTSRAAVRPRARMAGSALRHRPLRERRRR